MIKGVKDLSKSSGFKIGEKYDLFKMTGTKKPVPKKDNGGKKNDKPAESSNK